MVQWAGHKHVNRLKSNFDEIKLHKHREYENILRSSQRCVVFIYWKASVAMVRVVVQTEK